MNKGNTVSNAKIEIISVPWYVVHYESNLEQQSKIKNQVVKKMATGLQNLEISIFMKQVNSQNLLTFELGSQVGINVPVWIYAAFQQTDRQHDQKLNNDTFYKMPVTSGQCIIETKKYLECGILLNYDDDYYSQGYSEVKEVFRALTNDNILQLYNSEYDFTPSNESNIG